MQISFLLILFLIIRILSNPIANVFQKKLAVENSSLTINFYTYVILSFLCLPFSNLVFGQSYSLYFWFIVFMCGFLCTLGILFIIKAINIGELSVIGPINSYKSVVGLIASLLLLKEIPTIWGILGIVLIIWGSKFIFTSSAEGFSFKLFKRKDIQYRLIALLLTGIEAAFLKQIIIMSSVEAGFILWCFMGAFWSIVFILITKKKFSLNKKSSFIQVLFIALCLGLMQYSTNFVFEKMNVGYALSLFQLSSLVTVFLGYEIFKEKNLKEKIIGTFIMILGSVLIILH